MTEGDEGALDAGRRAVVELLEELVPPGSGNSQILEEECSLDALAMRSKCRPLDRGDYLQRLASFGSGPRWFNMPLGVSPIECARRGWRLAAPSTKAAQGEVVLTCDCCGVELRIQRLTDSSGLASWLVSGAPLSGSPTLASVWADALVAGHSQFCPWRSHEVTMADPWKQADREILEAFQARLKGLKERLRYYPALAGGSSEIDKALEAIAIAGWEAVASTQADWNKSLLQCSWCLRMIAVQSFAHYPVEAEAEADSVDEPPRKVARREPLAPTPELWTPRPWQGQKKGDAEAGAISTGGVTLDPHACHRFYCPYYSRADDNLSNFAEKVIRICTRKPEAAAAKANSSGDDMASDGGAKPEQTVVLRAEELLCQLNEMLVPPGKQY